MVKDLRNPLKKYISNIAIRATYVKYLEAINDLSNKSNLPTNKTISDKIGVSYSAVKSFFLRHDDILKIFINYSYGNPTVYSLNDEGIKIIRLMRYFKHYYSSLKFK